jgi:hypothetical protein
LLQRLQTTKFSASMIWHAIMILKNPWATPLDIKGKYDFLENESIVSKLLEFEEQRLLFHLAYRIFIVAPVFGF